MSHVANWLKVNLRPSQPHAPTFEVFRGGRGIGGGVWYWHQRSSNGQVSGTGGEDYASKWNAKRAAYAQAARIDGAKVVVISPAFVDSQ